MKIGFDISPLGDTQTGCGYFTASLLHALAELDRHNDYWLYPTFGDHYWNEAWAKTSLQFQQSRFRRGLGHRTYTGMQNFWQHPPADAEQQLGRPEVVHSNNFFCPTSLHTARLLYTLYDLSFLVYPDLTLEETRVAAFQGVFNASLYAQHLLAISAYTRQHFLATFPHYPAAQISVAYPASRFSLNPALPKPTSVSTLQAAQFWLSVGVLEPRKNHERLLQAYTQFIAETHVTWPLVLAGGRGWLMNDFEKKIDDLGLTGQVLLMGYVSDSTLQWLYQNCFAFLYPSLFEGFGMPVLEAMSLGAAVITSRATALPEIVGETGLLIDPLQTVDIASAMHRLWADAALHQQLKTQALIRSRNFSWAASARQVLDIYHALSS